TRAERSKRRQRPGGRPGSGTSTAADHEPERHDDGPWPRPGPESTAELPAASPATDAAGLADSTKPGPDGEADEPGERGHEHGYGPRRPARGPEYTHDGHDGWRTGTAAARGT